jgi:hypothetical protein
MEINVSNIHHDRNEAQMDVNAFAKKIIGNVEQVSAHPIRCQPT